MYHSIFTCSVLLALLATARSKSIGTGSSEEIVGQNIVSINATTPAIPLIHNETDSDSKPSVKRSLTLVSTTEEEKEDEECKGQKTKRCKTSAIQKGAARAILHAKNAERLRINARRPEYFVGQKPDMELVSLKNPATKLVPAASPLEIAKNATYLDEDLINSLRKQLTPNDSKVGITRNTLTPKTNVIENDKFICYCRERNGADSKKDTNQPSVTKGKTDKKTDIKKMILANRHRPKPVHTNVPHQPVIPHKLPAFHPRYPPGYSHNRMYPSLPRRGKIPYIPYAHHANPLDRANPKIGGKEIPTKINIPFNSLGSKPDSIVGQRAPIDQEHNFDNSQQIVGQAPCPSDVVGNSLTQSSPNMIPATSSETTSSNEEDSNASDYNLQSVHADSSGREHLTPSSTIESSSGTADVQPANQDTSARSSTGLGNEYGNEYETTGSGTVDYSDIKEVTTAYFTSKAYTNETGRDGSAGYDDSRISSAGPMNTEEEDDQNDNVSVQDRNANIPAENSMEPDEAATGSPDEEANEDEEEVVLGESNPNWNQEQPTSEDSKSSHRANEDEGNAGLGESEPKWNRKESTSDDSKSSHRANEDEADVGLRKSDPKWNQNESTNDDSNEDVGSAMENPNNSEFEEPSPPMEETTVLIPEGSVSQDATCAPTEINDKDAPSNEESSAKDYATESPETEDNADPLKSDYERENFGSGESEQKIGGEESDERSPTVSDSFTGETINSDDSGNDYTTIAEDFINTDNERVGTARKENENDPASVESTLKSSTADDDKKMKDPSNQTLPFCDNTLLQKSIKAVINNFAAGDSSEMYDGVNGETVGASRSEDLLPEIVEVPNLKSILSMPPIENTIVDKVKDYLSRASGMPRKNFDSDWATNVIRDNLRHTMSAAPASKTELPPMFVEEREFENGRWITNVVTLEPPSDEGTAVPTDLERLQANVKSLLRNPAVGLQAAKNPAVRNMIVESVRHNFAPEASVGNKGFDESVIQSTLNDELNIMEMENEDVTTTEDVLESTTTFDVSDIDMDKLLGIAKSEAGQNEQNERSREDDTTDPEVIVSSTTDSLDDGIVGAERDLEPEESTDHPIVDTKQYGVQTPEATKEIETDELGKSTLSMEEMPEVPNCGPISADASPNVGASRNEHEFTEDADGDEAGNAERMKNTKSGPNSEDFTYLGKIAVQNEPESDDLQSLRNSELFYIGDGVKLPLEIRKLKDGSYALSISRKVCEHLLNKECPCCVPVKGNVIRAVRREPEAKNADRTSRASKRRRISKRESAKSILLNGECVSADDSLQIFSMPVESFARRYNLSLSLEKVQTPWNFDTKGKIDERLKDRAKNFRNKEGSNAADTDLRNPLSIRAISENAKPDITIAKGRSINVNPYDDDDATSYKRMQKEHSFERYRYQRNTDESTTKREAIVKSLLYWLRDTILSLTPKR